jgi:hypothetical protein
LEKDAVKQLQASFKSVEDEENEIRRSILAISVKKAKIALELYVHNILI